MRSSTKATSHNRRGLRLFAMVCLVAGAALALSSAASASSIVSAGPLTSITVSPDLNCSVNHSGDSSPEWYGTTACGTLAVDQSTSTLYGPASIPAGGSASPSTAFTPISQTGPTGTGTAGIPSRSLRSRPGASGLTITQTDTYVVGQESYRTDVQISNSNPSPRSGPAVRGRGLLLAELGLRVRARRRQRDRVYGKADPASRIEQLFPLTSGSSYMEAFYNTIWAQIGAQACRAEHVRLRHLRGQRDHAQLGRDRPRVRLGHRFPPDDVLAAGLRAAVDDQDRRLCRR